MTAWFSFTANELYRAAFIKRTYKYCTHLHLHYCDNETIGKEEKSRPASTKHVHVYKHIKKKFSLTDGGGLTKGCADTRHRVSSPSIFFFFPRYNPLVRGATSTCESVALRKGRERKTRLRGPFTQLRLPSSAIDGSILRMRQRKEKGVAVCIKQQKQQRQLSINKKKRVYDQG